MSSLVSSSCPGFTLWYWDTMINLFPEIVIHCCREGKSLMLGCKGCWRAKFGMSPVSSIPILCHFMFHKTLHQVLSRRRDADITKSRHQNTHTHETHAIHATHASIRIFSCLLKSTFIWAIIQRMASQANDTYDRQQCTWYYDECWVLLVSGHEGAGYRTAAGMLGLLLYRRKRTNIRYLHGNIIIISRQYMISTWWARTRPATRAGPRPPAAARRAAPPRREPGNIASLQLRLCVLCLKEALTVFCFPPNLLMSVSSESVSEKESLASSRLAVEVATARVGGSAANRAIGEVVQSRRRPLLDPSPGWKRLLALSHLRHYAKLALTPRSLNVKLGPRRNYHKGRAAIRHYANQPAHPLWLLHWRPNFTSTYRGVNARSA